MLSFFFSLCYLEDKVTVTVLAKYSSNTEVCIANNISMNVILLGWYTVHNIH